MFNGTEEKTNEIIEHYEENTSTDTVGHGYSGYSMSNNAKNAYEKGSMPFSKWNKKNIIERIKNIVENYDIPFDVSKLDKMTLKDIKDEYLKKDGYHHTSKFYNTTDFYKIDIEKVLENKENTEAKKTENFASFEELQEAFKNDIEEAPEDYEISDLNEALKDLGITEDKPLNMDTPIGNVEIRKDRFEHIFNGGGDGHLPDKKRYKSINKMVLTLKSPTLIVETETGKKTYIKLFKTKNGSKNQVAIVYNDKNGDFIYTSMPVDKDKKYLLNRINNSTIIYKKGQSRVAKSNSAANNSIPNSDTDFNPDVKTLFQPANTVGVEKTSDVEAAKKEWKEKGTDSNYFKKWFGDSKVKHSTTDKPIIVYHSSDFEFNTFKPKGSIDFPEAIYFSSSKAVSKTYGNKTYACFLKIENPYIIDAQGQSYNNLYDRLSSDINYAVNNGYDGVIVRNIRDDWGQHKNGGRKADTYIVFNSEQIKSVDNQGMFDGTNPNIYYQAMISGINPKQKVDVIDLTNNFSTDKNLSKKELSTRIKTLIGAKLTNKDKKAIIEFVKKSKRVGKKDVYVPDHIAGSSKVELNNKGERNTFVNNLTNLITNSVLIDKEPNKDKKIKPNVDNYLRFYVPVKINNDVFTVRITAENNTSKNLFNILNADVYDVIVDKKTQASSPSTKGNLMKPVSNNIVPLSQQNSSVEQISIEEMLKDVKAPDGTVYFQSAYHGGAKDFDRFDLSYALSGEGAMAHGYGVYTAKNRDVSENYRKTLAQSLKNAKYDGVPLSKTELTKLHHAISEKLYLKGKDEALKELELLRKQSEKNKDKEGFLGRSSREFLENYNEQLELLNSVDEGKITGVNKGQLFEVDIPEDDVLLDEDKPFSKQSIKVKKALRQAFVNLIDKSIDRIYFKFKNIDYETKVYTQEQLNNAGFKVIGRVVHNCSELL